MTQLNAIGLNSSQSKALADSLNQLLASYQVFYMNVRGFHWNISGSRFFELHVKYEELYNDLQLKIDELAERILTLGSHPMHSFAEYLEHSRIQTITQATTPEATLQGVLGALQTLLVQQREIMVQAGQSDDEGTAAILGEYIKQQEKLVWMYNAGAGN